MSKRRRSSATPPPPAERAATLADERPGATRCDLAPDHSHLSRPAPADPTPARRGGGDGGRLFRRLWRGLWWTASLGVSAAGVTLAALVWVAAALPEIGALDGAPARGSIVFLDVEGREIARRGPVAGATARLEELPPYLIDAVLSVEDKRFYSHNGIDPKGLARAALANLTAGRVVQGGSTITQQLVKNLYLDGRRTADRKIREALLALRLEASHDKADILETYLNRVYFGGGAYGVDAAARRYFGKPARDVTVGEAALLAGLLKAPSRFSPTNDAERASARATLVLDAMAERGLITPAEREAVLDAPVRVRAHADPGFASHFVDWIAPAARELAGTADADIVVRTTLDLTMQTAAETAIARVMDVESDIRGASEAALVALDADGAVRAMVGGRDYDTSSFNRAVQARRQPGSAFKPFVFAAAMEAGFSPWAQMSDAPIRIGDWEPANYKNEYEGEMALITALAKSVNTVAVRLGEEVGRDQVARMARRMGMTTRVRPLRAMALGVEDVSLLELSDAYLPFANHGYAAPAYAITEVAGLEGEVLWRRDGSPVTRALADRPRRLMNLMLARVVADGTGRSAALPDRPAAGKTGTTNDFRDAWFVGYTPGLVAGVWVGNDDHTPMRNVTGGTLPARIWRGFMIRALAGAPVRALDLPAMDADEPAPLRAPEPIPADVFAALAGR
ncbi:MAG: PBP1A family penicillin-binding protein [Caulobacterales bacterium]|nr:PBP1A family penicillin-binding protein [Caulobacterales bacterium]